MSSTTVRCAAKMTAAIQSTDESVCEVCQQRVLVTVLMNLRDVYVPRIDYYEKIEITYHDTYTYNCC